MNIVTRILRNTVVLVALGGALAACGGGGGGSNVGDSAGVGAPVNNGGGSSGTGSPTQPTSPTVPGNSHEVVLTWDAPTTRTDGSCLGSLQGYRVNYGLAPGVYSDSRDVDVSQLSCSDSGQSDSCGQIQSCSFKVDKLGTASWYFAVQAVDTDGQTSGYSNEIITTVQ